MSGCRRILVVEDNEDIRDALESLLESSGYLVEAAFDGRDGLAKLSSYADAALVLLDLMMPKMTGWELLKVIKADTRLRHHKVITVSAVDRTHWSADRVSVEPDGMLTKPIRMDELYALIDRYCEN